MQKLLKYLTPDLFFLHLDMEDQETLFRHMFNRLQQQGMVKETFLDGIVAREARYPTGLQLGTYGCALPHTDTSHVIRPAIAVATLLEPMVFRAMGNPSNQVNVNVVFMMALQKEQEQVAMLSELAAMFQNKRLMGEMMEAKNSAEILALIQRHRK